MSETNQCPCTPACPLQKALTWLGGKWKLPILCSLMADGPSRYNTLLRKIHGISNTMLSQTLKELERDNLVLRLEYMEVPIRVEYELTEKAARLRTILEMLVQWTLEEEAGLRQTPGGSE